jgi:hypothetical protein
MVDDELRKVAEDMRALARSLAKDFRDAVDQAHRSGHPTSEAFKHGLRGMADEVKRGARASWGPPRYRPPRHGYGRSGYARYGPGWNRPAPPPPPGPGQSPDQSPDQNWCAPPWAAPPWARHHRSHNPLPPVRRRWDATTVIGILAVLFGVAWLLGATHAVHVSVEAVVALGLMLLGAALVITGRTDWSLSRRSWPVWLGAAMIVVLIATSSTFGVGSAIDNLSFGNTNATATGATTQTIHGGFGDLTVDAHQLAPGDTLNLQSIAGNTYVTNLPQDETVQVNAHVFAGQICVHGHDAGSGIGASTNQTLPPASGGQGAGTVTLDIHQAFGQVFVAGQGCAGGHHG